MLDLGSWDRIVLTGGSGFLGGRFRAHVDPARMVEVVSPLRAGGAGAAREIRSDATQAIFESALRGARSILVVHLATRYVAAGQEVDLGALLESNVGFPSRLVTGLSRLGVPLRVVNPSTVFQYYGPDRDQPISLYAATKEAFRSVLRGITVESAIRVADLVIGDTVAPDDPRPKLIPRLAGSVDSGSPIRLGSGRQVMSLMHADDVVAAIAVAARLPDGAFGEERMVTWSIDGAITTTVAEVVATFQRCASGRIDSSFDPARDRPREMSHGIGALGIPTLPGYAARRSLEDLVRSALDTTR